LVEFNIFFLSRSKFAQHSAIKETLHSIKGRAKPSTQLGTFTFLSEGAGGLMATFNLVNVSFGHFRG